MNLPLSPRYGQPPLSHNHARYDSLNRLTQKNYPDSTSAEYAYDLVGKILSVNDPTGSYGFAYL
jgi:YD repeat-containing protein